MKGYQKKIIGLFYKQKEMLASLYGRFARKFPEQAPFWRELAEEKIFQAGWLENLYAAEQQHVVLFDEGRVKTYTLETSIDGIRILIDKVESDTIDVNCALVYTADLERSLIEKESFTYFKGLNERANSALKLLKRHTDSHLLRVEQMRNTVMPGTECRI